MTEAELIADIMKRLGKKEEIKYIKTDAIKNGFTSDAFEKAYEEAQLQNQIMANRDPTIRLFLGPALLIIAGVTFYTNYNGRFWGISTAIALVALYYGLRMIVSLGKQRRGK